MCQAIKDMKKESMAAGKAEGFITAIKAIIENFHATAEQAIDALKIPESERAAYLKQLQV